MINKKSENRIKIIFLFLLIFTMYGFSDKQVNTAAIPTDRLEQKWWKERHEKILKKLDSNPQLILIGNSILHALDYPDRKILWENI